MDGGTDGAVWRTESSAALQHTVLSLGAALGALLVYACRPDGAADGNRTAGLILGVVLLAGSGAGLALLGRQVVIVDPARRVVTSERHSPLGSKATTYAFDDIVAVGVQTVAGYRGVPTFCVMLRLRSGKRAALFVGFFEGQYRRAAMEARARRLERYLEAG